MGAPVVRWQILSSAPDQIATFYSTLFGWTVEQANALGYRVIHTGSDVGIPGGVWPAPPGAPTFVQLFMEVEDVAATVARAEAAGAQVIVPRSALPDGDVMAVLRDPSGSSFGVVQARTPS